MKSLLLNLNHLDALKNSISGLNLPNPILFIDEYESKNIMLIEYLRNLSRALGLPCVLASTNSKIINTPVKTKKTSASSQAEIKEVRVYAIRKLPKANILGMLERLSFDKVDFQNYIDKASNDQYYVPKEMEELLSEHFQINFNSQSINQFKKLFMFLLKQSQTCLQGVSFYSLQAFIDALKSLRGKELDCNLIWESICCKINRIFIARKSPAFSIDGAFYSLYAFSLDSAINSTTGSMALNEGEAENSINSHFYYFGNRSGEEIVTLSCDAEGAICKPNNDSYSMKSHFSSVSDDFLTHSLLWFSPQEDGASIASIIENFMKSKSNLKNNSNSQEFMVTLSISNASHRSFNGQTRGIDFFTLLIKNLMVFVPKYPGLDDLLKSTPPSLSNFLERVSVPYLVPNLTPELQSDLQGIVRIGECRRCSDNEGVDVAFTIFIDNVEVGTSYVECKYVDNTSNNNHDHKHYISKAKALKCPFFILVTYKLESQFKVSGSMNPLQSRTSERNSKIPILPQFLINVYSIFFNDTERQSMTFVANREYENLSGVFLIIETNFSVEKI